MITYEFETEIENGTIKVPENLVINKNRKLKVIIVLEDNKRDEMKKALLNSPVWSDEDVEEFQNAVKEGGSIPWRCRQFNFS